MHKWTMNPHGHCQELGTELYTQLQNMVIYIDSGQPSLGLSSIREHFFSFDIIIWRQHLNYVLRFCNKQTSLMAGMRKYLLNPAKSLNNKGGYLAS